MSSDTKSNNYASVFYPRKSAVMARRGSLVARAVRGGDVVLFDSTVPLAMCASPGDLLDGHNGSTVTCCRYSRDGRFLVSSAEDGSVQLWDTKRCKRIPLRGHKGAVYKCTFNAESTVVATCGEDGTAILWDISPEGMMWPQQQAASASASTAAASSTASTASARNIGENKLVLRGHAGRVMGVATCDNLVATASEDQTVMLWDILTGQCIAVLEGHQGVVYCVHFSPRVLGTPVLASASEDGSVIIWDVSLAVSSAAAQQQNRAPPKRAALYAHEGCVFSMAFSRDGIYLATSGEDRIVIVWDTKSWKRVATLKNEGHTAEISCVAFPPTSSNQLASASDDGLVMLWDIEHQKRTQVLEGAGGVVNHVHYSPDGSTLAASYEDGTVVLWDVAMGKLQATLQAHSDECVCVCFSDGTSSSSSSTANPAMGGLFPGAMRQQQQQQHSQMFLATGGRDRKIVVWDLKKWKQQAVLEKHVGAVTCLTFSPDLTLLVSGSDDTTAVLWEVEGWQKRHTLRDHEYPLRSIRFEPGQGAQHNLVLVRTTDTSGFWTLWNCKDGAVVSSGQLSDRMFVADGSGGDEAAAAAGMVLSGSGNGSNAASSGGAGGGGGGSNSNAAAASGSSNSGLDRSDSADDGGKGGGSGGGGKKKVRFNNVHSDKYGGPYHHDPADTGLGAAGAGGSDRDPIKKLEGEYERIRRSYVEEEKVSRFFLLQDRAVHAGMTANRMAGKVAVLDRRDRLRDIMTARLLLLEKEEVLEEHKLHATNELLASQVAHLVRQNHGLEKALAALTGKASKSGDKVAAGMSTAAQTFFSVEQSSAVDDASWLPLSAEEPFRFRPDAVAFQVLSPSTTTTTSPSPSNGSSKMRMLHFALCQKKQQEPAAECFIDVDPPLLIEDRCAKGGLAGRPMYGCSLARFDALRLSKGMNTQFLNWLQLSAAACTNSQRVAHVEIANSLFAAAKANFLLQAMKRQHLALMQHLALTHQQQQQSSSTSSRAVFPHWFLTFVPLSKGALLDMALARQASSGVGVVEGGNLLAGVVAEHQKMFKPVFDQCSFKQGNAVAANTPGCHATLTGGGIISSVSVERAVARSILLDKKSGAAAAAKAPAAAGTGVSSPAELFAQAAAQPAVVPVLMCAVAVTTVVPAVFPNTSDAKNHEKLLLEQQGSSTVLVAGCRRSCFDKVFMDSGNCDYIEAILPKGCVPAPLGVLWMNTTSDFREDVMGSF